MKNELGRLIRAYEKCIVSEGAAGGEVDSAAFWAARPQIDDPKMKAYASKYGKTAWLPAYVYDGFEWDGKDECTPDYLGFLFFRQGADMIQKYDPDGQYEGLVYSGRFEERIPEELADYLYWSGDASLEDEVAEGSMFMDKECAEALVSWMVDTLQNDWQSCDPRGFAEDIW